MLSETRTPGMDACAHRGLARTISVFESEGRGHAGPFSCDNRHRPARVECMFTPRF